MTGHAPLTGYRIGREQASRFSDRKRVFAFPFFAAHRKSPTAKSADTPNFGGRSLVKFAECAIPMPAAEISRYFFSSQKVGMLNGVNATPSSPAVQT
jgi:hypothetical protein